MYNAEAVSGSLKLLCAAFSSVQAV